MNLVRDLLNRCWWAEAGLMRLVPVMAASDWDRVGELERVRAKVSGCVCLDDHLVGYRLDEGLSLLTKLTG